MAISITNLSGGNTPADGSDPRTFPAIWNATATDLEGVATDLDTLEATVGAHDLNSLSGVGITTPVEGDLLTYNGTSWVNGVPAGGSILQVVSTTKTDHFTATPAALTYVDVTGLSASITPISTSSTILVIVNVMLSNSGGRSRLRLMRDATEIGGSSTSGFGFVSINPASGTDLTFYPGLSFSDAPATTSELTYKIQGTTGTTSVAFIVNKSNSDNHRGTSSITVMEVAG
jgi:hypothetical protein